MNILNLYAGIGGNRKLWGDGHNITSVEYREDIATVYKHYFPKDTVIIADAHRYLLDHFSEFDFIWSAPPCPTHSRARYWGLSAEKNNYLPVFPDMTLYQEILFIKHHFNGKYVIENVIPYYTPLIPADVKIGRHLFWANFPINQIETKEFKKDSLNEMYHETGFNLHKYNLKDKIKVLRNCVQPDLGLHILETAQGIIRKIKSETI